METRLTGRLARTLGIVLLAAAVTAHAWAQAGPPLGTSPSQAQSAFADALESGSPSYGPYAKAFLVLPPAGRTAAVEAAFAWARSWYGSDAFKTRYATRRAELKPEPRVFELTVDEELKATAAREARDREETLAALPAEQREQMRVAFEQVAAMEKDPQFAAMRRQGLERDRVDAQREYEDNVRYWEANFPADPQVLVVRHLQNFLAVSADVDYAAELVTESGTRKFANPAYERKPEEWKLCFRAGREATTAARQQAEAWLQALSAR